MSVRATKERILVIPDPQKETTESGIIISTETYRPTTGTVASVGRDVDEIEIGHRVIYSKFTGDEFDHEGQNYISIHESAVYALCF